MPTITVTEVHSTEAFNALLDGFEARMREEGQTHQEEMSNERSLQFADIRRFVATDDAGRVVGWMNLKPDDGDLKIEGLCADPDKINAKGTARALVNMAVNISFKNGKGGTLVLTNSSKGTGDSFYLYMGFRYIDGLRMRLTIDHRKWDTRVVGQRETKRGHIDVVEFFRKEEARV